MATTTDSGHDLDMARHAGEEIPDVAIPKPQLGSNFEVDGMVVEGKTIIRPFGHSSPDTLIYE